MRRESAPPRPADPAQLVGRLLEPGGGDLDDDQAPLAAQYELVLEAGRRPELRPLAERWNHLPGRLRRWRGAPGCPASAAEILADLIEGALLGQLALPRDDFIDGHLRPQLDRLVDALA